MTWTAAVPQAVFNKWKLEANTGWQNINSDYHTQGCFNMLQWCLQYGMETLQRKVRPAVTLIQRKARESAGTDVICHVTGFYPREVEVNWIRDGEALLEEGVWSGEVLPNGDRTYQLRKTLTVSPEDQKKHSYSCQVNHASLDEKMDVKWVPEAALNMGFVAGGVLAALGLIITVIIGALIWKKRASVGGTQGNRDILGGPGQGLTHNFRAVLSKAGRVTLTADEKPGATAKSQPGPESTQSTSPALEHTVWSRVLSDGLLFRDCNPSVLLAIPIAG
ncbi:UNVERIFIED_CONTAM: hypothetical protein FKN15_041217 [Acipenser sinensis]